jgi:hypothetical protein
MYNKCTVLLSVALHLPLPLSGECVGLAMQLEKAEAGSDQHTVLLAKLKEYQAWNEWAQVAETYFLHQGQRKSPRVFFYYWRDELRENLNAKALCQYRVIANTIKKKKDGEKYTDIDIRVLMVSLGDNLAGNDDGIDAIALLEEEDNEDADDDEEGSDAIISSSSNGETFNLVSIAYLPIKK